MCHGEGGGFCATLSLCMEVGWLFVGGDAGKFAIKDFGKDSGKRREQRNGTDQINTRSFRLGPGIHNHQSLHCV